MGLLVTPEQFHYPPPGFIMRSSLRNVRGVPGPAVEHVVLQKEHVSMIFLYKALVIALFEHNILQSFHFSLSGLDLKPSTLPSLSGSD
ncbi:hypothetical protein EVAR_31248_1 [Eumeta japonica]|uniref:Uncharacterized protein n=1 Tax=Eumeta variegata TaxID=151549 RepID=A0A4C1VZW4_EUMVA|nr:hypothetical protein EVAR_31248_1 [Eumeta japonica]